MTLQRFIETNGIPTVIIASLPTVAQQSGAPRILAVDTPMGAALGEPGNRAQQTAILTTALQLLTSIEPAGIVSTSAEIYRTAHH